jgi:capsular polysaccharide biosynthesis protein
MGSKQYEKYLKVFVRWAWLIILLPVVTGILCFLLSRFVLNPVYQSSITLYVISKDVDNSIARSAYTDNLVNLQMVKDYRELIKSEFITETVIDELDLPYTPEELAPNIDISSKNDTRVIAINVLDIKPERAQLIANKLGDTFIKKARDLVKLDNIEIVGRAKVPKEPIKPNLIKNTILAVIAGFAAAISLVMMVEYLDDTIKTAEDVKNNFNLNVLGMIPNLKIDSSKR